MGPIAHVYDVIARIITYTEPSAAFNLASTCKSWSDNALDVLWEDVDGKVFIVLGLSYPETRSYIVRFIFKLAQSIYTDIYSHCRLTGLLPSTHYSGSVFFETVHASTYFATSLQSATLYTPISKKSFDLF